MKIVSYKSYRIPLLEMNSFKTFDDALLDRHPELKEALKPNDEYPEFKNILKNSNGNLPIGSFNTKVIINDGKIVERIFKSPKGQVFSLLSKSSNIVLNQAA